MLIGLDLIFCGDEDSAALIVKMETGISYTAQCGGITCMHPSCEGFVLRLPDVDCELDCSLQGIGCIHEGTPKDKKMQSAKAINEKLKERFDENNRWKISFDFERLDEFMESWWPVRVSFSDMLESLELDNAPAIFCNMNNCD